MRGHPLDYDDWAGQGGEGVGLADVLPDFHHAEGKRARRDALHGAAGPLTVAEVR